MEQKDSSSQVLDRLEGVWVGQGRATFPTTDTFDYRETLTFERRDDKTLAYQQRTEKRPLNQPTYQPSHWENGFIRILPAGELELVDVQSSGRVEILAGTTQVSDQQLKLNFLSRAFANDERVVASGRIIEIEGNTLRYEMTMQTTRVEQMTTHLTATLQRVQH